jgi:hypothetical protein
MIEILEKELRLMRKLAEREGTTIHEHLDDTRGKTSHQMCGKILLPWVCYANLRF